MLSIVRSIPLPPSLRAAVRRLAGSPRLSIAAVVCIALGTAATSAALTLVTATLLRPLPFPHADRLVRVWFDQPGGESRLALSYPDLRDLRETVRADRVEATGSFDALEATARARLLLQGEGGARRVEGEAVTRGYFDLLGVKPLVGRLFTPEEHRPGGPRVMLLDYRTWGERYGFDDGIVGRTVRTDEGVYMVIGVLPRRFTGSVEEDSGDIELWVPIEQYLSAERRERRDVAGIWTIGRLAPGASVAAARAELAGLGRHLAKTYPEIHGGRSLTVEPLGENWRSGLRRGSFLLLAASVLLLLVAAVNVAALLLARAIDDRREMAIRVALGARRRRLIGRILTETGLLVAAGSLIGLWLGPALLRAILSQRSLVDGSLLGIPAFVELRIDPTAAALCCLTFLATALIAALGPALLGSRVDPARALQEGTRAATDGRRARRWSSALIVTEVALTTVLVVGAALLVRSYHAMQTEDLGFRTDHVLRIALFVNEEDVPETTDLPSFYDRVRSELAAAPGVALVSRSLAERIAGASAAGGGDAGVGNGRRAAAPLGRVLGTEATLRGETVRIVGVVEDARFGGPREADTPAARYELYLPFTQAPQRLLSLIIATDAPPETLVPALSRRLADLAPASALDWIGPLDRWVVDLYMLDTRFLLTLLGLFSLAGLCLSAVGLAAVLADSVARRRPEIGVRQALGATPRRILATVVGRGLCVVLAGLGVGAVLAWSAGRLLASFVYQVTPTDPWTYAAAALVLLTAAVAASVLPARQAAAVDPAEVLREG